MSDTFHKEYKKLEPSKADWMKQVKEKAQELHDLIGRPTQGGFMGQREITLAKTQLETAIMWAVKGITK